MEYQIKPDAWNGVFAFPNAVVDQHIKLAGSAQLKVLLWIFRHNGENISTDDIANALGMMAADVIDAMQYWIENNLLTIQENTSNNSQNINKSSTTSFNTNEPNKSTDEIKHKKTIIIAPPSEKPTFEDVARRLNESDELKYLFQQAQMQLGKTISPADQVTLLWIHDWLGLPVEVILMIIGYAVIEGKTGMAYIEKVSIDWANKDIFTIEKAEEQIQKLQANKKEWNQICAALSITPRRPSKQELNYAHTWLTNWQMKSDAISYAYDECVNHTGKMNFPYINKILERWYKNGITSAQEAKNFDDRAASYKQKSKQNESKKASYDIDEFERMSLNTPIIYKSED